MLQSPDRDGVVDYAAAYDLFTMALSGSDDNANLHLNAGWTAAQLGQSDNAIRHYRNALRADVNSIAAMYNLAAILSDSGQANEAVNIYRLFIENNPEGVDVRNSLVDALREAGDFDGAIAEVGDILMIDIANTDAYRNLSRVYYDMGQMGLAALAAEKAKLLSDSDPGIYNNLGMIYLQQGDTGAALESFQNALILDPNSAAANLNLGWLALSSGDYDLANERFGTIRQIEPGNVSGLLGYAVALRGTGDLDGAAEAYATAIQIEPSNGLAYQNASALHANYTNDFDLALQYLDNWKTALVGDPSYGLQHPVHGIIQNVLGLQGEWAAEQELISANEREAEEFRQAQIAQLEELRGVVEEYKLAIDTIRCPMVEEMGMIEEFDMVAETAIDTIDAQDFATAQQLFMIINEYQDTIVNDLAPFCEEAPVEEAPVEE